MIPISQHNDGVVERAVDVHNTLSLLNAGCRCRLQRNLAGPYAAARGRSTRKRRWWLTAAAAAVQGLLVLLLWLPKRIGALRCHPFLDGAITTSSAATNATAAAPTAG